MSEKDYKYPEEEIALIEKIDYKSFNMKDFIISQYKENELKIILITGRPGAGKSTIAKHMKNVCDYLNIPSEILCIDFFFKLGLHYADTVL